MGRRTLLLVAALLLAAIGTGALYLYVSGAADNAREGGATVEVLVPARLIPAGTTISEQATEFRTLPIQLDQAKLSGLLTNRSAVAGKVAKQNLQAGVPVIAAQFGGAVRDETRLTVEKGQMALTIEVEDPARVSDFLFRGARVAVFVVDVPTADKDKHETRLLLPEVTVLTTGTQSTISTGTATAAAAKQDQNLKSLVTLQVTQEQAGKILVAQSAGQLYLALLGEGTPTAQTYDDTDITVSP